ncbi:665_t:CDS:2 [Funneliformis mosseae]|uniref:665_t:CDS:1 n=1 Tax=Funneliformis mosseae TaxID=27381 RepID=A0A9N9NJD7_FUNMO|nr:665_t:CDS:2 [Funneliformis mosseae]
MKKIDKALTGRFQYKDVELKWVLQSLHCHYREFWKISLDLYKDEFKEDCETLMNEGEFHSDEISKTDEKLTKKEIEEHIWPKNKNESYHSDDNNDQQPNEDINKDKG